MIGIKPIQGPSPGPRTANDMAYKVSNYVQAGNNPKIIRMATDEINIAIDRINSRNWEKMIGFYNIPLLADHAEYGVPAEVRETLHAELLDVDYEPRGKVVYWPYKNFMERFTGRRRGGSGRRTFGYTFIYGQNKIWLSRKPSVDLVGATPYMAITYTKRLQYLENAGDSHGGPSEFNAYLIWAARAAVAESWGELTKADRAERRKNILWQMLVAEDAKTLLDYSSQTFSFNRPTTGVANPYRWGY